MHKKQRPGFKSPTTCTCLKIPIQSDQLPLLSPAQKARCPKPYFTELSRKLPSTAANAFILAAESCEEKAEATAATSLQSGARKISKKNERTGPRMWCFLLENLPKIHQNTSNESQRGGGEEQKVEERRVCGTREKIEDERLRNNGRVELHSLSPWPDKARETTTCQISHLSLPHQPHT